MPSFLRPRSNEVRVEGAHNSFTIDDHRVDHVSMLDPATGLYVQKSIAATEEELHERELASMRHALASVDHRIDTLDPADVMPYEEPLSAEQLERKRIGLENEREWIVSEIARLEAPAEPEKRKRR
jgi:hypothetical protein